MFTLVVKGIKHQYNRVKKIQNTFSIANFDLENSAIARKRSLSNKLKLMFVKRQLKKLMVRDRFYPVYQPLYNCQTDHVYGAEVLARLPPISGKTISPVVFIPLLEELHLIDDFGDWILKRSIKDVGKWISKGYVDKNFLLSINVSATQLENSEFNHKLIACLNESNLHPQNIQIEITETERIKCFTSVARQVSLIRGIGCSVALDDFGTGFSNIIYLSRLDIDCVKVDKDFLLNRESETKNKIVLRSIMSMANILNIKIIFEGVETLEHRFLLQDMGHHCHQGKLFSMPVVEVEFLEEYQGYMRKKNNIVNYLTLKGLMSKKNTIRASK